MSKSYNEEFKKQVVTEYIKGKSYAKLSDEYGVARSTIFSWVRKYSEECHYVKPQSKSNDIISAKEMRDLHKKLSKLEKENLFLKKAATFFAKEMD